MRGRACEVTAWFCTPHDALRDYLWPRRTTEEVASLADPGRLFRVRWSALLRLIAASAPIGSQSALSESRRLRLWLAWSRGFSRYGATAEWRTRLGRVASTGSC